MTHSLVNKQLQYTYCPISGEKGNQTMKFGQLMEYNMRNIFLQKSYTKCGEETSPRPFSGKLKLSVSYIERIVYLKNKKRSGSSLPALFSA